MANLFLMNQYLEQLKFPCRIIYIEELLVTAEYQEYNYDHGIDY